MLTTQLKIARMPALKQILWGLKSPKENETMLNLKKEGLALIAGIAILSFATACGSGPAGSKGSTVSTPGTITAAGPVINSIGNPAPATAEVGGTKAIWTVSEVQSGMSKTVGGMTVRPSYMSSSRAQVFLTGMSTGMKVTIRQEDNGRIIGEQTAPATSSTGDVNVTSSLALKGLQAEMVNGYLLLTGQFGS